ncbi:hypothetical protein ACQY0O_003479 [Thecaphora frezii]
MRAHFIFRCRLIARQSEAVDIDVHRSERGEAEEIQPSLSVRTASGSVGTAPVDLPEGARSTQVARRQGRHFFYFPLFFRFRASCSFLLLFSWIFELRVEKVG